MRLIGILLLTAGLALASPALAADKGARAAAPAPPPPSSDPGAQLIAESAQYTGAYQTLLGDASIFFGTYVDGASRAYSGPAGDDAWVGPWLIDMRARQAALRARRAALGPPPAALIAKLEAGGMKSDADELKATPQRMGAVIDSVLDLCDEVLAVAPAAAKGDPAARARLARIMIQGSRTALASENAMMQASLVRLEAGSPQGALIRSILASNTAIMGVIDLGILLGDDPKADPSALIKQVRDNLELARGEARKTGPLAQRMMIQVKTAPADAGFKARLTNALSTYEESGQVEVQIVGCIEALLQADSPEKTASINEELRGLVLKRLKLQTDRQTMLGG